VGSGAPTSRSLDRSAAAAYESVQHARPKGPGDHARRETMIGNLKVLLGAGMALVAFGGLGASAAHAVEQFHCSVKPCTLTLSPDGAGPTAHGVIIVKNAAKESGSFTCESLTGDATLEANTTEEITTTGLVNNNCKIGGVTKVNVRMNSCDYLFTSPEGAASLGATIHIQCPGASHIEIENTGTGCIFEVTPQTLRGAHYHNIGTAGNPSTTEITVEVRISEITSGTGITVEVGKEGTGCVPKSKVGDTLIGEITTGNTLFTAEKDNPNKEMVEGWWL
jgi:hypothetical protein